ncbi:MAG TPA: lysyl oxidase family protein [Solirubrobacterales bacterium]|nr:lysyl oxidase family protein [Solirubrobacterales bacterium]
MKRLSTAALAAVVVVLAALAGAAGGATGGAGVELDPRRDGNPCTGPGSGHLLCPDLRVGPAEDLYIERRGSPRHEEAGEYYRSHGRVRLHAGNDIRSRGRGPVELRGHRYKRNWMRANQAIHRADGPGVEVFRTQMRLHYFFVGYRFGGSWWKVRDPLSMEIWSLDERRRPLHRLRKGPKVLYCFRDLERTRPGRRSPRNPVYPACSQDPSLQRTKMGTSVGWSDIYPADYDRQWVDVTGLRGCYAFVMRVDPENHLYESREDNNRSVRIVRLPQLEGARRC